jgi:hypothetical protein
MVRVMLVLPIDINGFGATGVIIDKEHIHFSNIPLRNCEDLSECAGS